MRRLPVRAICLLLAAAGCASPPDPSPSYRCGDCNVVLISVDTLRADHVGAYGYAKPTTPNIDALAAGGVVFENAIAQSSWTRPAHMSIMTGLHPREHGYVALADRKRLDDGLPTLASVLRGNGYVTGAFTGGMNMAADFGFDQGFDVYRSGGKYFHDNFEDVRDWLSRNGSAKFFLFFHGYDAHTPYLSDPIDREAMGLPPVPPDQGHKKTCREHGPVSRIQPYIDEYDGAIHRADRYVGMMLAELKSRGLAENTIVIVLSDHGEEFLEHGRCFHLSTLHREVLHVPLIISAPRLSPRRVSDLVPASVSVAPTILQMLGVEPALPGPSLLPAALGDTVPSGPVISETERSLKQEGEGLVRSLTTADEKLIEWITRNRYAWFDVRTDPHEQHPLTSSSRQEILAGELERWSVAHPRRLSSRREARGETTPDAGTAATDEERNELERRRRDLRSFGYVE